MGTIQGFILRHRVHMGVEWADENPHMDGDDKWKREATHWKCTLRCGGRRMTVYFSQGAAHTGEPERKSVLDCLASDAGTVENSRSFEEWANELGYDTDSRKAERTWTIVTRQRDALERLLGREAYEELLHQTERL